MKARKEGLNIYKFSLTFKFNNRLNLPYNICGSVGANIYMLNVTFLTTPLGRKGGPIYYNVINSVK